MTGFLQVVVGVVVMVLPCGFSFMVLARADFALVAASGGWESGIVMPQSKRAFIDL